MKLIELWCALGELPMMRARYQTRYRCAAGNCFLWIALVFCGPVYAAGPDVLFDGHIHYSQDAWPHYPPKAAVQILKAAGIGRALVSSTPDDGTLKLYELAPDIVVPVLRPYRSRGDMTAWFRDPEVFAYVKQRLASGIYAGLGEFHLFGADAKRPEIARYVQLAARHGLFLQAHADAHAIETLAGIDAAISVVWAHGGMTETPTVIRPLLRRYPNLWVELSYRYDDIYPGEELSPAWRKLFMDHPERFILGTDTWAPIRWDQVSELADTARAWLAELPAEVARRIASENGARLIND